MLTLTQDQKKILINKTVEALRSLPEYNPEINGIKVRYGRNIEIALSGPDYQPTTLYLSDFKKLINKIFISEGLKIKSKCTFISHRYDIKDYIKYDRKILEIIIRSVEFI